MEKGDGRQDKKFSENSNSSKEKGKSKFPSLEPSKWAKYHQGGFYDSILYNYFIYVVSFLLQEFSISHRQVTSDRDPGSNINRVRMRVMMKWMIWTPW